MGGGAFLRFYLLCGLGGAVLSLVLGWGFGRINPVVGASAAVYGVLLAFAWAAPDAPINVLFFPAPIAAKWLVTFLVAVSPMLALFPPSDGGGHPPPFGGLAPRFLFPKVSDLPLGPAHPHPPPPAAPRA